LSIFLAAPIGGLKFFGYTYTNRGTIRIPWLLHVFRINAYAAEGISLYFFSLDGHVYNINRTVFCRLEFHGISGPPGPPGGLGFQTSRPPGISDSRPPGRISRRLGFQPPRRLGFRPPGLDQALGPPVTVNTVTAVKDSL
jgi:hypothetical protein